MPQVQDDGNEFTLQLNGATPHFNVICTFLNENLPNRWIGRSSADALHLQNWPIRSPKLSPLDLFIWRLIEETVFLPPLPQNLRELRAHITSATYEVNREMLQRVWSELVFRIDICRIVRSAILSIYEVCRNLKHSSLCYRLLCYATH